MGVADFNGDGQPDYLLYNVSTRQTGVWYLKNNVLIGGALVQLFQLTGKWSVWQTSMVTAGPITCFSTLPATKRQSGICLERPLFAAPTARVFLTIGIL